MAPIPTSSPTVLDDTTNLPAFLQARKTKTSAKRVAVNSEVRIIRKLIFSTRILLLLAAITKTPLLYDYAIAFNQTLWPNKYGFGATASGILFPLFGTTAIYQPPMRILVFLALGSCVVGDTVFQVLAESKLACLDEGRCPEPDISLMEYPRQKVQVLYYLHMVSIAMNICAMLSCAYISVAWGCCRARYPFALVVQPDTYAFVQDDIRASLPLKPSKRARRLSHDLTGDGRFKMAQE